MLFRYGDLPNGFRAGLGRWCGHAASLVQARQLYNLAVYAPNTIESRFLLLTRAVESFHRARYCDRLLGADEFSELEASLRVVIDGSGLPKRARSAFSGKLKWMNQVSLRRRLQDLVRDNREALRQRDGWHRGLESEVADARNDLTHGDVQRPVDPERLIPMSRRLEFLLEILFLREIGIDGESVAGLVARCETYGGRLPSMKRRALHEGSA